LFASYTTEALHSIYALASSEHVNFLGAVTWSFEFEDQPYFAGFRELASNGLDKPVLNAFRMFGMLGGERVQATSSAALSSDDVVLNGVRARPDINAIATRTDHEIQILIWNYHDDDLPAPAAPIDLTIEGLPPDAKRASSEHFRIDAHHSNAFTMWKGMASPQSPSPVQYEQLQDAGQLQLLDSPAWISIAGGAAHLQFSLPRQGVSLIRIAW
jgi:xylan 1,4-beta-xylosidase